MFIGETRISLENHNFQFSLIKCMGIMILRDHKWKSKNYDAAYCHYQKL